MTVWLLAFFAITAAARREWPIDSAGTLVDVLGKASAGDSLVLEPGEYILSSASPNQPALHIDRPLTLRSRDPERRAVLRADNVEVLLAVTSGEVELRDLVVGAQFGHLVDDEHSIDIYFAAGTAALPAGGTGYQRTGSGAQRVLLSRGEILAARALQSRGKAVDDASFGRALAELRVSNVDFSHSRSHTNVAFARGAYADVRVEQCSFGAHGANAIVGVRSARFVDLRIERNSFPAGSHVLLDSPTVAQEAVLGLNHWQSGDSVVRVARQKQSASAVYCLDRGCTQLAPIVDGADPTRAFGSLGDALAAGVTRIVLTADVEESGVVRIESKSGVTIDGSSETFDAQLTLRNGARIESVDRALVGVRALRVSLQGASTTAFSFVSSSGGGGAERLALFERVSFVGDGVSDEQRAVQIDDASVRVELLDCILLQLSRGVHVERGALTSVDSTYFGMSDAGIFAETSTHAAALRVSGSTFIGCGAAIELSARGSSSALRELSVTCSTFLFNEQRTPIVAHDCAQKPTLCAAALRFNTIVSDHESRVPRIAAADARLYHYGANHVEHGRDRHSYIYYGPPAHFSLSDTQGRLSWASGALSLALEGVHTSYVLASYAPLRAECLALGNEAPPAAAVVSDVLQVHSDTLQHARSSTALGVRYRVDGTDSIPPLAVFGVARVGSLSVGWRRQRVVRESSTVADSTTLSATLSASDAARSVVVALELFPDSAQRALTQGAALVADSPLGATHKRLCVACGKDAFLPARLLDERCGGNSDNVVASLDDAFEKLGARGTGAPRSESLVLFVYGECALERHCTLELDQHEHLEGLSSVERASIVRRTVGCATDAPLVSFTARATDASIRYATLQSIGDATEACSVRVAASEHVNAATPTVSFNTLANALCVKKRGGGGRLINNDIGGALLVAGGGDFLLEANRVGGNVELSGSGGNVRMVRNEFVGSGFGVLSTSAASINAIANRNLARFIVSHAGVRSFATDNTFVNGAQISIGDNMQLGNSGEATTLHKARIDATGTARLLNWHIDESSTLHVDRDASVVLRNVQFDNVGASLDDAADCETLEFTLSGVDVARSRMTVGETQIFTSLQRTAITEDPKHTYWRRSDGAVARCSEELSRRGAVCACPAASPAVARAPSAIAAIVHDADAREIGAQGLFDDDDDSDSESSLVDDDDTSSLGDVVLDDDDDDIDVRNGDTLAIVLGIVGGIFALCILIGCCLAFRNTYYRGVDEDADIRMAASRARPQPLSTKNIVSSEPAATSVQASLVRRRTHQ